MKEFLTAVIDGQVLSEGRAGAALSEILAGSVPQVQIAAFLAAIQMRGIALSELRGFHGVLRKAGKSVDLQTENLIDVCGTGGDGKNTFNISTLTAFALAGAGIKVAKHGNASATSGCGSSDILAHLGVKFTNDENVLRQNLAQANICYLHAPLFQPLLKTIAPVRSQIGFRTFFNLLGPLLNPARPRFQFIGVNEPSILRLYRYFLEGGETGFSLVHSRDSYDEISLTGAFDVATNEGAETYYPEDLGFEVVDRNLLYGGANLEEVSSRFLQILKNEDVETRQRNVVVANAAFAIHVVHPEYSLDECKERAKISLISGAAHRALEILIAE